MTANAGLPPPESDDRAADGSAYERVVKRYVATCPVEGCAWRGRRNDHESDAYSEIGGHLRRDHEGRYVSEWSYKHMIVWERITE